MSLKTEIVEHNGMRLTISEASVRIGLRRLELSELGRIYQTEHPEIPPLEAYARIIDYPNMVAPVIAAEGVEFPIEFKTFFDEIPEEMWEKWNGAVRRLNPHWFNRGIEQDPKDGNAPSLPPTT